MSCLFNSLAYFYPENSHQIRINICRYLFKNPNLGGMKAADVIYYEKRMNLDRYVGTMSLNTTWGGAIEIKAFCDLYGVNILVYSIPNRKNIEFLSNKNNINKYIYLSWNGYHYEPIKK